MPRILRAARKFLILLLFIWSTWAFFWSKEAGAQAEPSTHANEVFLGYEWKEGVGFSEIDYALDSCRASLAAWLWEKIFTLWEKKEWDEMAKLMEVVIWLQPHQILYADQAAWQMAWNASAAVLKDSNEAHRQEREHYYIQRGRAFLEEGISKNPGSSLLYEHLGLLLRDKLEDHLGAAEAFDQAAALPGAAPYLHRFAAYELTECPGREQEGYDRLMALYQEGKEQRMPMLLAKIKILEEKRNSHKRAQKNTKK
ncbi:MAG: hypothetical protein A3F67_01000 [Verrucomicrobia bacterium RIFCSPHIGHO2_12_FULL_41_10]|nr:MAG: hypothetical protein A3F67_01000 [Verrucomicrobia bacterium RIFCSPHIGHO2_12_FULL_41_10]HLB33109.1 hypothetical protein [Chthoniobacterales bacterium]